MDDRYCFFKDKIIPLAKAKLSPCDLGVLRGYGIFDFLRTYNRRPFLLDQHLERFNNSAKMVGLEVPYGKVKLKEIINDLIEKNNLPEYNLRLVLTGGESPDGKQVVQPILYILAEEIHDLDESCYLNGVKIISKKFKRSDARVKTTNYLEFLKIRSELKEQGALEPIYYSDEGVTEGATCNIFIFKDDILITPSDNILIGTTRNFVMELAKEKFKVKKVTVDVLGRIHPCHD